MSAATSSCVVKRQVYDSEGILIDQETIVKRPVKDFVENAQFE